MAPSSARVTEFAPSIPQKQPQAKRTAAEVVNPIEHLQARFDDAFDRAEELGALVRGRQQRGMDYDAVLPKLKEAEADKRNAYAALRKMRWMKVKPSV